MAWGTVTITYAATGYTQNYKRNNVVNHGDCQNMVAAAVADSVARIAAHPPAAGLPAVINVARSNINQNLGFDPGPNYRVI